MQASNASPCVVWPSRSPVLYVGDVARHVAVKPPAQSDVANATSAWSVSHFCHPMEGRLVGCDRTAPVPGVFYVARGSD
jgi:hypothetical protein